MRQRTGRQNGPTIPQDQNQQNNGRGRNICARMAASTTACVTAFAVNIWAQIMLNKAAETTSTEAEENTIDNINGSAAFIGGTATGIHAGYRVGRAFNLSKTDSAQSSSTGALVGGFAATIMADTIEETMYR